jgi:antitoxin PrlF
MSTATLTSKGQITIPVEVRRLLNVQTGDRLEFEIVAATRSVRELKGMFGKPARSVSIEDMNRTIAERGAMARPRAGVSLPARAVRGRAK